MEKQFVDGLIFKAPHTKAPEFVKGSLSIKVEEFKKYLDEHNNNGWVNIDLKESKSGKYYAILNEWKPEKDAQTIENNNEQGVPLDEIPF